MSHLDGKPAAINSAQFIAASNSEFRDAGISRLATLQAEFRERFKWSEFVDHYREFLTKHITEPPGRAEFYFDDMLENSNLEALEYKFADRVIEAYSRWSQEDAAVVLWDVDYTMGANPGQLHSGGDVKDAKWGFRPAFLALIEFLADKFPNVKNGILSTRTVSGLSTDLENERALAAVKSFIDAEHIYTSYGMHEEKPRILSDIRKNQVNAKSIDDDEALSKPESANGTGVYFSDCPVNEELCVMISKDRTA